MASEASVVVLLSGGLDSATTLAMARSEGRHCVALSVNYGQRHQEELLAAKRVAEALGVEDHRVVSVDFGQFGGSALTDASILVPKDEDPGAPGVPVTYVPARNTILLSLALGLAETLGAFEIHIGANVLDYSGYPDCRPEFLKAFETLAQLATKAGVENEGRYRVVAPLIDLTKAEIIQRGTALGLDYGLTISCYDPQDGLACGRCDACTLRRRGFESAQIPDPTRYVSV